MHSPVKKIYWLFPSFGNFATLSKIISVDYIYLCCAVLSCSVVSTVFDPMECSPPGYSVHGDSPGRNTGVGCHALLQGIFPTQESNPHLLHYRQFVYHLSHQGSSDYIYMGLYIYSGLYILFHWDSCLDHWKGFFFLLRFIDPHPVSCRIPKQGLNPCLQQWKCEVLTTGPIGNSLAF